MYDVITIDVSFISLREIVPVLPRFTKADTDIYLLYKPQFEV
jgi:predicted rRNA methylase YqxC with S4 and FtsJ domains